jgi:Sulfotransferase family
MMPQLRLIFVHTPKSGGTSMRAAVTEFFSHDLVLADYGDRPNDPISPMNIDPHGFLDRCRQQNALTLANKAAVIGHFWIAKYGGVSADVRATILREPISRAISQFFFWPAQNTNNALHQYVISNRLTFIEFARIPRVNSLYTSIYFRNVDMAQFDFIGTYDRLSQDWTPTLARIGIAPAPPRRELNRTVDLVGEYETRRSEILHDHATMAQLRDLFAADLRFYERFAC